MLVVIDGLDASGKSTQAEMLAEHLRKRGKTYVLRSHPSEDNFFGIKGREYLFIEGKKAHIAASLFYLADVIRSITLYALEEGRLRNIRPLPHGNRVSTRPSPQVRLHLLLQDSPH